MLDPYSRLNSVYDRLYPGLSGGRRPKEPGFKLSLEEQRSLLKSLGSMGLSGLSYAGLALGKPSAAVRGTISGLTGGPWGGGLANLIPFSDTLGITDVNKRIWGRDLLERLGAPKNRYQGFQSWKHPGDLAWDFAGFGTEVALDPLFYMTLGMSGASVPGRIARRAGLLADKSKLAMIAGRKLAQPRAAQMALRLARRGTVTDASRLTGKLAAKFTERLGPRQAAMHTTLRDLIGTGTQGGEWIGSRAQLLGRVTDAARKMGVPLQSVLDKPVGGLLGIGPPFGKPWVTLGQAGGVGEKIARRMDKLGHAMAYGEIYKTGISPGRIGSALFRPRVKETLSTAGQKAAVPFSHAEDIATKIGREKGILGRQMLDDLRIPPGTEERLLLEALELKPGVAPSAEYTQLMAGLNPAQRSGLDDIVQYFRGEYQSVGDALDDIGQFSARLPDESPLQYAARYAASGRGGGGMQAGRLLEPKFQSLLRRKEPFRDIFAWKSQAMANDPLLTKGSARSLAERIARIQDPAVHGIADPQKARKFADYLIKRETGHRIYQHPWESLTHYGVQGRERLTGGQATQAFMAKHMQDMRTSADPNLVPMEGILKQLRFVSAQNPHVAHPRALEKLAEALRGRGVAIGAPDEVLQFGMRPDLARDVTRFMKSYTQPDVLQPVLGAFDSFLNAFKNLVTGPFLAFHGRNWFSGQMNAWISDMFSPKVVRDVDRLLRQGTAIPGLRNAPAIAREMAHHGMQATDANALKVLQRMVFRNEVIGRYHGQQFAQTGQAIGRLEESIPGRVPSGFGARLTPLTQGSRRDWLGVHKLRGVFGQAETQWPLAKAGENIGKYVEDSNRLSPFVKLLFDGWDDAAAAQKVAFNQVSYAGRAYTATERSLFTRAFPFWKFFKGMSMWTGAELATKPGGKLAQILRATHKMRGTDQPLPEYVAQGMAVPIPEGTPLIGPQPGGDKRFLTGGGFMHEDPLQFLGGGLRGMGMEALSRLNPLLKGPLEFATGQSFFQRGPAGGRPLEDLDPTLGRTLSNIAGMGQTADVARRRKPVRLPQLAEVALANQPLTRFMTTLRTLTDPRKRLRPNVPIPSLATALNLATGARLSDVPERTTDALLREAAQRRLKETGAARAFEKVYIPKEILEQLPPHIRNDAQAVQAILRMLAMRAQQRAQGLPQTRLDTARSW